MPITHNPGGSTSITGDSIDFFRLAAIRSAVSLECKGIRARRGPAVWKQAQQEFKIPGPRNKHAVLAWLDTKVAEERPKQEHVDESGTRTVDGQLIS